MTPTPTDAPRRRWLPAVLAAVPHALRAAHDVYHPERVPTKRVKDPSRRGLSFEDVGIATTRDALTLAAWVVPGAGPHTVVVSHGMGKDRTGMLDHIALLHGAGHHVVAFDMRNHGASGDDTRRTAMAERYTSDLTDVVRFAADRFGGSVAVLAFSFATWPAVCLTRDTGLPLAAVVCESGPTYDIRAGFRRLCELRRSTLPAALQRDLAFAWYRWLFVTACRLMLAVRGWPLDLRAVAPELLFIAGGRDPVIPADQIAMVADRCADQQAWVVEDALHMNALRMAPQDYARRVGGLLDHAFAAPARGARSA